MGLLCHLEAFKTTVMINRCMPSRYLFNTITTTYSLVFDSALTGPTDLVKALCNANIPTKPNYKNMLDLLVLSSKPTKKETHFCRLCQKNLCWNPKILENRAVAIAYK